MSEEIIRNIGMLLLSLGMLVLIFKGAPKTFKRSAIASIFSIVFLFPLWAIWAMVEVFTREVDPTLAKQQLMVLKYIGAFILSALVSFILIAIAIFSLDKIIVHDLGYLIVYSVVCVLIYASVFILIYNIFHDLNVKKVFPYLIGLGGLRLIVNMWHSTQTYFDSNIDLTISFIAEIASFVAILYAIRAYYIGKTDRWY